MILTPVSSMCDNCLIRFYLMPLEILKKCLNALKAMPVYGRFYSSRQTDKILHDKQFKIIKKQADNTSQAGRDCYPPSSNSKCVWVTCCLLKKCKNRNSKKETLWLWQELALEVGLTTAGRSDCTQHLRSWLLGPISQLAGLNMS